jgi:hypothetical protein
VVAIQFSSSQRPGQYHSLRHHQVEQVEQAAVVTEQHQATAEQEQTDLVAVAAEVVALEQVVKAATERQYSRTLAHHHCGSVEQSHSLVETLFIHLPQTVN